MLILLGMKLLGALVVAVVAVGCGDDEPGPHDVVECESEWLLNVDETCERACVVNPGPGATDPCPARGGCTAYVEYEGVGGCCERTGQIGVDPIVYRWFECEE